MITSKTKIISSTIAGLLILFSAAQINGQIIKDKSTKPNIVVILADDLGWMDVGYNGMIFLKLPTSINSLQMGWCSTGFTLRLPIAPRRVRVC